METPKEILDAAVAAVETFLQNSGKDYVPYGDGSFTITKGSAVVMMVVRGFTDTSACVEFVSNIVSEGSITPEVMEHLLRQNAQLHYGAFGLLFDGTISFSYTLTAAELSERSFNEALNAVAIIADHYDDPLAEMTGGKRAADVGFDE